MTKRKSASELLEGWAVLSILMACPSNSTRRSCPFNAQQPFLSVHCPFFLRVLMDFTWFIRAGVQRVEVSIVAVAALLVLKQGTFFYSLNIFHFGINLPAAMASFTALSSATWEEICCIDLLELIQWRIQGVRPWGGGGGGGGVGGVATPPFKPAMKHSLIGNSEQKRKIPKGASTRSALHCFINNHARAHVVINNRLIT